MRDKIFTVAVVGLDAAKQTAMWGTNGRDGKQDTRYVRLIDCGTEHLQAILRTQWQLTPAYLEIIKAILSDRSVK